MTGVAHQPRPRDTEIFSPIPGHSGYEVSDHGTVRSVDRVVPRLNRWGSVTPMRMSGKVLSPTLVKVGYLKVTLGAGEQQCYVHHLVLLAFVGPRPEGEHINHKDGNKLNNHISNLEYCTRSWNQAHAHHCGLYAGAPGAALSGAQVIEINERLKAGEESAPRIARGYGVSKATVYDIRHGRSWAWLTGR